MALLHNQVVTPETLWFLLMPLCPFLVCTTTTTTTTTETVELEDQETHPVLHLYIVQHSGSQ